MAPSTERIINYLNTRDTAINAVFFQVFQNGDDQYGADRSWDEARQYGFIGGGGGS
jgi:hypothetical protein